MTGAVDNGDRPIGHAASKAMARALGRTLESLRVLSVNHDPFTVGSPAHVRDAQWFKALWERHGFTDGVHLRRIHYRILGQPGPKARPYENTSACWSDLKVASAYARWLELIDPAAFVDRRNPGAVINAGCPRRLAKRRGARARERPLRRERLPDAVHDPGLLV